MGWNDGVGDDDDDAPTASASASANARIPSSACSKATVQTKRLQPKDKLADKNGGKEGGRKTHYPTRGWQSIPPCDDRARVHAQKQAPWLPAPEAVDKNKTVYNSDQRRSCR